MNETTIISNSRFTILHDGEKHCLITTKSEALLKRGSMQDCLFQMEMLKSQS